MRISHEQLKEALVAATLADFHDVPAEGEIDYSFSDGFEAWAAKLLRRMRGGRRYVSTAGRVLRAILIAAIIAALLAGTAMAIPAVRNAVKKFFVRKEGDMHVIEFYVNQNRPSEPYANDPSTGNANDDTDYSDETASTTPSAPIPIEYRFPAYLPEGLQVDSEAVNPFTVSTVMSGPNGLQCDYCQSALPNGSNINAYIGLGSDYVHTEKIICGILMDFFEGKKTNAIIWTDEFYLYHLVVNADMPMEEIEKIISSIAPRDDLNHP